MTSTTAAAAASNTSPTGSRPDPGITQQSPLPAQNQGPPRIQPARRAPHGSPQPPRHPVASSRRGPRHTPQRPRRRHTRPGSHHRPWRADRSHRPEGSRQPARRTPSRPEGVRPSPAVPGPGGRPCRPRPAQRGTRHRPHRHGPCRQRAGSTDRGSRLGRHRCRALARSEEPRPPGRRRPPGCPAPPDNRRPRTRPAACRTRNPPAQGGSPSRSGRRRASSRPRPRRADPRRPGLACARHRPRRRRSPRPPTPPAPQGSRCPTRVDHCPPTRPGPDNPHPTHQPQPRTQPPCRSRPPPLDHHVLGRHPAGPEPSAPGNHHDIHPTAAPPAPIATRRICTCYPAQKHSEDGLLAQGTRAEHHQVDAQDGEEDASGDVPLPFARPVDRRCCTDCSLR